MWLAGVALSAQVKLSPLFTDNMVLQQQCDAPIWGETAPGRQVKVVTSWDGATYQAVADKEGKWKLALHTPTAGGPYCITLDDGTERRTLQNVMIGEVWLCSGQSNMEMPLYGDWAHIHHYQEEIAQAQHPDVRLLYVTQEVDVKPRSSVKAHGDGWDVCSPQTIANFSATAYFFGRELQQSLHVPVGLILSAWGGTDVTSWMSAGALKEIPAFAPEVAKVEALANKQDLPGQTEWDNRNILSGLYNTMIHPLIPFAFRGAIWYQGEHNVGQAEQYGETFTLLIESWRREWGRNFPFYFVQLPNYLERKSQPMDSDWARLREAQTKALQLENTGMAVLIDKGEANDIHPKDKQSVGYRLALQALARTYRQPVVADGPVLQSYSIEGNRVILTFDCGGSRLQAVDGQPLRGFAVAGHDHVFHWAEARIQGMQVVVTCPEVDYPLAVRYAWADNPDANLYNAEGLPAAPFRTDRW